MRQTGGPWLTQDTDGRSTGGLREQVARGGGAISEDRGWPVLLMLAKSGQQVVDVSLRGQVGIGSTATPVTTGGKELPVVRGQVPGEALGEELSLFRREAE